MDFLTVPLESKHNRKDFYCGNELLDNYLRYLASQDIKRKLAACFVLSEKGTDKIKGYYTLSNNSIPHDIIPDGLRKKLPLAYRSIPATLLGRLATDNSFKGMGIGKLLLIDALRRSHEASKTVGSYAVVVDPIDTSAEEFYRKYGFIKLPDSGKMFLPMQTIIKLFKFVSSVSLFYIL